MSQRWSQMEAELRRAQQCTHLVVVIVAVEEGLLAEDHRGEHAAERPDVERVVIHLQ